MSKKLTRCFECCAAVADKNGQLLGTCVYIALPDKVAKEGEYPPLNPEELISLTVKDGELVVKQLTDAPVQAVITGFGRYSGSKPNEKIVITKEEFLAPLTEGKVNLDPLFFNYIPVSEVVAHMQQTD